MKQRKTTWKAIVAVILVMVTLFSISMAVSAGFVGSIFAKDYTVIVPYSNAQQTPYVRYENGAVYSVTFYNSDGLVETRIDYQGTAHWIDGAYRLPHQHNYTYFYGPNGEGPSRHDNPTYTNFRQW